MTRVAAAAGSEAHSEARALLRASSLIGIVLWLFSHHWLFDELLPSVMAFAVLVMAPLAVGLGPPTVTGRNLPSWAGVLQPVAALGVVTSLALRPSFPAALFAVPWLGWTLILAWVGVRRLLARPRQLRVAATATGMALLPIGAAWLLLGRAGLDPAGFGVIIVFLTAVHFHYVALGVPTLLGLAAAAFESRAAAPRSSVAPRSSAVLRLLWFALVCVVSGMFLVAGGITFSSWLGLLGALVLTVGMFGYAWVVLTQLLRSGGVGARLMLAISALSAILSMPLALAWAYGQVRGELVVELEWMIRLHGMANAHGVIFAGLVGFWLLQRSERAS